MNNMLSNRFFQVYMGDKSSRWHRLTDGLPQGSVLAPVLFNLYLSANDIALTYQANLFLECEASLEADLERLKRYFRRWGLQPNPAKTETCVFHLSSHDANRMLDINFADTQIQHPKFTLDRSLTYNTHFTKTVADRVNSSTQICRHELGSQR
jgi:Reverse transcriptase (RNA-dependent DNA polymerase)